MKVVKGLILVKLGFWQVIFCCGIWYMFKALRNAAPNSDSIINPTPTKQNVISAVTTENIKYKDYKGDNNYNKQENAQEEKTKIKNTSELGYENGEVRQGKMNYEHKNKLEDKMEYDNKDEKYHKDELYGKIEKEHKRKLDRKTEDQEDQT